jgi:hypothetical protein
VTSANSADGILEQANINPLLNSSLSLVAKNDQVTEAARTLDTETDIGVLLMRY